MESPQLPFDVRQVVQLAGAVYEMPNVSFIIEDLEQIYDILCEYAALENLPKPEAAGGESHSALPG